MLALKMKTRKIKQKLFASGNMNRWPTPVKAIFLDDRKFPAVVSYFHLLEAFA